MRVIPVIDLMGGQVVRGVGGRRDEYRPIKTILADDARPATIGRALAAAGFREAYVADLDAISGAAPAWSIYEQLLACPLTLAVDAGISSLDRAIELAQWTAGGRRLDAIVAGLESLADAELLADICLAIGPSRLIFSLDLRAGVPLVRAGTWQGLNARQIAAIALRCGVRRMIVLDLAAVGMGQGVGSEPLCRELASLDPELEIIAGGGVRGANDLRSLEQSGCRAALVASALHDGRLSPSQCATLR